MFVRLVLISVFIQPCIALWWSLSLPSFRQWKSSSNLIENQQFCSSLTFLTVDQRVFCSQNPKIFSIIHRSLRLAIDECQYQFRHSRWNCSIFDEGKLVLRKTSETAFISALTSASIMHHIAKACAKGELSNECGCAKTPQRSATTTTTNKTHEGFEWGGCSDDLKFGRKISSTFVDRSEERRKIGRFVTQHNNEAGRQILERNVQLTCKCHGVSGSCTLRVCWRTLPEFRLIGSELKTKYLSSMRLTKKRQTFNDTDLIYLQRSPTFCEKNRQTNRFYTEGRECHLNSHQSGSCSHLCCDRGYRTIVETIEEDCQCEFHWCCEVRCQRCSKRVEQHFCR